MERSTSVHTREMKMNALRNTSNAVVKIDPASHAKLQGLARTEQRPMGEIVNELIERYELEQFWNQAHAAVERLRADPVAWKDYQDEISMLEGGSMDVLKTGPPYYTPEEEEAILAGHARTQGG
jgi:predicted DNA-binding protein